MEGKIASSLNRNIQKMKPFIKKINFLFGKKERNLEKNKNQVRN